MSELTTLPATTAPPATGAAQAASAGPAARPGGTAVGERGATDEGPGTELAAFAALLAAALSTPTAPVPDAASGAPADPDASTEGEGTSATGAASTAVGVPAPPTLSSVTAARTAAVAAPGDAEAIAGGGGEVPDPAASVGAPPASTPGDDVPVDLSDAPRPAADAPRTGTPNVTNGVTASGAPVATDRVSPTATATPADSAVDAVRHEAAPRSLADTPGTTGSEVAVPRTSSPAASAPTSGGGATAPAPAAASRELVGRVLDALDLLEHAPPPRRMTIEVPDADGLRLHVSLRGSEVHVAVQSGGAGSPDLSGWGRELSAGLASRGFDLGGFSTDGRGDPHGEGAPRDEHDPRHAPRTDRGRRHPARTSTDTGLRL